MINVTDTIKSSSKLQVHYSQHQVFCLELYIDSVITPIEIWLAAINDANIFLKNCFKSGIYGTAVSYNTLSPI